MNRAQRRAYNKRNHTHLTFEDFQAMMVIERLKKGEAIESSELSKMKNLIHLDNVEVAPDGAIVKLNYDNVLSRPQEDLTEEFKTWIEENKDKEFHLTREGVENSLVAFEEDVRECELDGQTVRKPKWLFDLYSDLLILDDGVFKTPLEIEEKNKK